MSKKDDLDFHERKMKVFLHLLVNALFVSIMNFTVWFAITFYTYLQTRSVFATGVIAGIFLILSASSGIWFGSLVDHHKKKSMMQISSIVSLVLYFISLIVYLFAGSDAFTDPTNPVLWVFILLLMGGVIAGNIRGIALPTLVTILVPENLRDKANGLVGTTSGTSFLITSVISGLLVAWGGMLYVLIIALVILTLSIVHLYFITVPEKGTVHVEGQEPPSKKVDLRGTFKIVKGVPGLWALILFSTFNNFLGGVFMSLMDAYGLELMSVQAWGLLWGVVSTGFIFGGLIIAKTGLGKNPVRTLLLVNVVMWTITILFPLQASVVTLAIGMLIYMYIVPFAEAAEQTILQRVVPFERQGRVFGFALSVEQAASPLTAFLISPVAQFVFIPFMATGAGVGLLGSGSGINRGIAIVFIITAIVGLTATLIAFGSKYYRQLSTAYAESKPSDEPPVTPSINEAAL